MMFGPETSRARTCFLIEKQHSTLDILNSATQLSKTKIILLTVEHKDSFRTSQTTQCAYI